jgi:hypothetical protein
MSGEMSFKAECVRAMRAQGALCYPMVAGIHSPAGWPDVLVVSGRWVGLVEFKGETTKVEPIQLKVIWDLNQTHPWSACIVRQSGPSCLINLPGRFVEGGSARYEETRVATSSVPGLLGRIFSLTETTR